MYIKDQNTTHTFPASGGTHTFYVTATSGTYITVPDDTWASASPATGSGTVRVTVTCEPNTSKATRSMEISFEDNDGETVYTANQDAGTIMFSPSSMAFQGSGGTSALTVWCPTSWSAPGSGWIDMSPGGGNSGTTQVTVEADPNTGTTARNTSIAFTWDGADEVSSYPISQSGYTGYVSPTVLNFPATGGTQTISVSALTNQSWTCEEQSYSFLTLSTTAGTGNGSVTVTATPNIGSIVRTDYINFNFGDGNYAWVMIAQEEGAPAGTFTITPGGATYDMTGQTKQVTVVSTYPWTAHTSADYVTISPTTGAASSTTTVNITAAANTGSSSRTFTVVFTNSVGGSLTHQGTQGRNISVSPTAPRFAYTGETKTINITCDYNWFASYSASWVTLSANSGSGSTGITITTQANPNASVRTADITFTDGNGNTAICQVIQDAYEAPAISVTGLTNVVWSSQTQYWQASANRTGTFSVTSSQNWCSITNLTQDASGTACTFNLSYGRNTGNASRSTVITISQGTASTGVTFTQAAASNYISVSPANSYCGSASTALYLSVTRSEDISAADVDYSTSGDLPYDSITWDGNKTQMVVNIPTNLTNVSRSLYITISGGTATTNASITQSPGTSIQVDVTGNTTAAYNATSASFTGSSTVQGTFTITSSNPSWCQVTGITQSGYGCTFQLTFGTNQGVSNRTSVINVTQNGVTHSFTFTQQAYQGDHYLSFGTPASRYASWQGGTSVSPVLTYNGILENTITMTEGFSGAMPVTSCTFNGSQIFIGFGQSTSFQEQSYTRTVRAQGTDGNYYSASFTWIQYPMNYNPGPVVGSVTNPIWKETVLTGVEGTNGYKLLVDNQVVYSGKIYTIPGRDIDFRINDIARDFLENEMDFTPGVSYPGGYSKTFRVAIDGGNSYNYTFYNDWSYVDNPSIYIGDPISPEIPAGALIPFSVYDGTGTITANGTSVASFGGAGQARYLLAAQAGVEYACGNIRYKGVSPCRHEYVIYYINAFGGMDAFTPQNSKMRTDNITSYDMTQRYNDAISDFTQKRYLAEVQPTWQFNTGWLTDAQSVKMHHLIESPLVYLYDCAAGTYTPVVMTENSLQYKTWFNQGKKKISYSFTLKQSQTKQRR